MRPPLPSPRFRHPLLVLGLLFAACNSTDFAGNSADKKALPKSQGLKQDSGDKTAVDNGQGSKNGGDAGGSDAAAGKDTGGGADSADGKGDAGGGHVDSGDTDLGKGGTGAVGQDGSLVSCPKNAQKILILDFKSGWWAGDGGQFFQKLLNGLHQECVGNVQIEYHHLVIEGEGALFDQNTIVNSMIVVPGTAGLQQISNNFANSFRDSSWASYTEIWMLSGAAGDPMDLHESEPFFQQVLAKIRGSKANLFIGAGFGSIIHANALSTALNLGVRVATTQEQNGILNVASGAQVASALKMGKELQDHVLFSHLKDLADAMVVGGIPASGDALSVGGGFTVIAHDSAGKSTIAVGKSGARRVVFDADLPRYYSIYIDASPGTFQLLKNIVTYLGR